MSSIMGRDKYLEGNLCLQIQGKLHVPLNPMYLI